MRIPFIKYLMAHEYSRTLHIVAYKGGGMIHTLCRESFSKKTSRTVMRVDRNHMVCMDCERGLRA